MQHELLAKLQRRELRPIQKQHGCRRKRLAAALKEPVFEIVLPQAALLAGRQRRGGQAVAALAYGTESVPRVDKICGPGNIFVTLAKRRIIGVTGIDALYGPTETLVIADATADPVLCAADLIAQAEHDEIASPIMITDSRALAERVAIDVSRFEIVDARDDEDERALERVSHGSVGLGRGHSPDAHARDRHAGRDQKWWPVGVEGWAGDISDDQSIRGAAEVLAPRGNQETAQVILDGQ